MVRTAKRRWWAPAGVAALALGLSVWGGPPVVNNSLSVWFVEDDPARVAYDRFQERYGNDEVVIVAVGNAGTPLDAARMELMERVARRMQAVEGVASVLGPADDAGPFTDLLLSAEGDVGLLVARLEVMADADARRHEVIVGLREAAAELVEAGVEARWAGVGLVYDELNEASFRETPALTGASFLAVGLVLYGITRSIGAVVLTLSSVVLSVLILMGLFAGAGGELNMVTAILPTLVLVLGTTNLVHIFQRLDSRLDDTSDGALRSVFRPCLFTALTTTVGFASLATARMAVVRDLGLWAALAVLITLAVSFVAAWASLQVPWFRPRPREGVRWGHLIERLADTVTRRPLPVLASALAVGALATWSATRIQVDTYSIEFFRPGHPLRVDSDAIEATYGWYLPLEVEVETGSPGGALRPDVVAAVRDWQTRVEGAGLAGWSISAADFAPADAPSVMPAAAAAPPVLPAGLSDEDASALRVTFGVPMTSGRGWADRIAMIRAESGALQDAGHEVRAAGYLPLYVRIMEYLVDTQVRSFAAAFVLVFVVMGVFLRSARLVGVAFLPNLLPIAGTFGVMGALGIRLDVATVTIAAIALGILVDDTVHLLDRFREAHGETGDPARAVREALLHVGPALFGTTLILAISFAVLGFASVLSIALFGLLTALTLLFGLVADLVVLPALLVLTTPRRVAPREPIEGSAS